MFASLSSLVLLLSLASFDEEPPPQVVTGGRQPQAAVDSDGRVWLTYARDKSIFVRSTGNGGLKFGEEQRVADVKAMDVGMRRGPRIAAVEGALLVTGIAGEQARGRDGDVLVWRSTDGGKTWSEPRQLNSVKGAAREGLQATAGAGKYIAVVWLDMRDKGTTLYGAFSQDSGETFTEDRLLYESPDGTVCECCAPQVAVDENGRVAVMFRNALSGNRDMYMLKSTDGGASFSAARQQGEGNWLIHACPMDGGALAIDGDVIHMIWRREQELFATSEPFGERSLAPTGERSIGEGENASLTVVDGAPHAVFKQSGAVVMLLPSMERQLLARKGEDAVIVPVAEGAGLLVLWDFEQTVQAKWIGSGQSD